MYLTGVRCYCIRKSQCGIHTQKPPPKPAPVDNKKPAPLGNKKPVPADNKCPSPVDSKKPSPVGSKKPSPVEAPPTAVPTPAQTKDTGVESLGIKFLGVNCNSAFTLGLLIKVIFLT